MCKIFLPLISFYRKAPGKGLAMASPQYPNDLELLKIKWWATWGWGSYTDERYVPMTRDWSCPLGKIDPQYLLVGNEPNYVEPYGFTMSPEHAVIRLHYLELEYPFTTMVVGNVSGDNHGMGDGVWWLTRFLQYYEDYNGRPFSDILGGHSYEYEPQKMLAQFDKYLAVYPRMWLTEYNLAQPTINLEEFKLVTKEALKKFERVACYTNRQDGGASSLPYPMDLIDKDGNPTDIGKIYAKL